MNILLSCDKILKKIKDYPNHNWIWVDIWETSPDEIQVVITINKEEFCHLGQFKTIRICSANTTDNNDIIELKNYGRLIVKRIRKFFPSSTVHSRLYYK